MVKNFRRKLTIFHLVVVIILGNFSNALSQTDTWVDERNIKNSTKIGINTIHEKGQLELVSIITRLYNEFDKKPDLRLLEKAAVLDQVGLSFTIHVSEKRGVPLEEVSQYYSSVSKHYDRIKGRLTKLGFTDKEGDYIMHAWAQISSEEMGRILTQKE